MKTERIALLTGTTSSGKTTLLEACLTQYGEKIVVVPELYRELDRLSSPVLQLSGLALQVTLARMQLKREEKAVYQGQCIVADRGLIDVLAHALIFEVTLPDEFFLAVAVSCQHYHPVFVCDPSDIEFTDSTLTPLQVSLNPDFYYWQQLRAELHQATLEVLSLLDMKFEMVSGDVPARVEQIGKGLYFD